MTHYVVIHALMMSWYPTGDVRMDLDPWRSLGVGEVVKEANDASCVMKKLLKKSLEVV